MNKRVFSIIILFSFAAHQAHAWCGWVTRPVRYVAGWGSWVGIGAGHLARDSWYVIRPELSTAERTDYAHNGKKYQRARFKSGKPVTKQDLDVKGAAIKAWEKSGEGVRARQAYLRAEEAQKKGVPYVIEEGVVKWLNMEAQGEEVTRLQALPVDGAGKVFSVDGAGAKCIVGAEAARGEQVRAIPDDELVVSEVLDHDVRTTRDVVRSYFVDREVPVSHEAQTEERQATMWFLNNLYGFKRNYQCFGCYIGMKPYALAWAAGLTVVAYKLYKRFDVYENVLKPNTHGLEADVLDQKGATSNS